MAKAATLKASRPSVKALDIKEGDVKKALAAAEGKSSNDIKMLPIDQIKVLPGLQPRLADEIGYEEGIEAIVNSIMKFGFMKDKPLAIFASVDEDMADVFYVLDGHGRLEATRRANEKEAGIDALPCVVVEVGDDGPWFETGMAIRNLTARELSPLSQAVHVRRLLDAKVTHQEIADRLGYSRRYIYDLEFLSRAPRVVLDAVKKGDISARKATAVLKKHEENKGAAAEEVQAIAVRKADKEAAKEQRATDKANGIAPEPKAKRMRRSFEIAGETGDEVPREEVERFTLFFGDDVVDWWKPARSKKKALLTRGVKFRMSISYEADAETEPQTVEEEDDGGLPEAAPAPRKARGKRAVAATAPDVDLSDIADRA